jgi:hypothetical protein
MITFRKTEIAMASTTLHHTFLSNISAPAVVKGAIPIRLCFKSVVDVHLEVLTSLPGIGHQENTVFENVDIHGDDFSRLQRVGLVR